MTRDLLRWLTLIGVVTVGTAPLIAADKPNIVVIMADDLGYGDVGWHGERARQ